MEYYLQKPFEERKNLAKYLIERNNNRLPFLIDCQYIWLINKKLDKEIDVQWLVDGNTTLESFIKSVERNYLLDNIELNMYVGEECMQRRYKMSYLYRKFKGKDGFVYCNWRQREYDFYWLDKTMKMIIFLILVICLVKLVS